MVPRVSSHSTVLPALKTAAGAQLSFQKPTCFLPAPTPKQLCQQEEGPGKLQAVLRLGCPERAFCSGVVHWPASGVLVSFAIWCCNLSLSQKKKRKSLFTWSWPNVCVGTARESWCFPQLPLLGPQCPAALTLPSQCLLLLPSSYQKLINYGLLSKKKSIINYVLCKGTWVVWNGAFSQPSSVKRNIWEVVFLVGSARAAAGHGGGDLSLCCAAFENSPQSCWKGKLVAGGGGWEVHWTIWYIDSLKINQCWLIK